MGTILIVCGAGASSTFLASRMRSLAKERGLDVTVQPLSIESLVDSLPVADAVLVGPHLEDRFEQLSADAASHRVPIALLPQAAFGPSGAGVAIDVVTTLVALGPTPAA